MGGLFVYLLVELGDFMVFIVVGNIFFEYVIGGVVVVCLWIFNFVVFCNKDVVDFWILVYGLVDGYNEFDFMVVGILVIICIVVVLSMKGLLCFNYIVLVVYSVVIIFIMVCGLIKVDINNYLNFMLFGVWGIFKFLVVLFFVYVGFDVVLMMVELLSKLSISLKMFLLVLWVWWWLL